MQGLVADYSARASLFERFRTELTTQISHLLNEGSVVRLGLPIESRVKTLDSLVQKVHRNGLNIPVVSDVNDLVGVRLVLLFLRDVPIACQRIEKALTILEKEDAASRLDPTQFGYGSLHYIVRFPKDWLKTPALRGMENLKAEIQIRTVSQHVWASASHLLQYKQETSVPEPLRRTIHRISALLEVVDLEFERVLAEKEVYLAAIQGNKKVELNVDSLTPVLDAVFPAQNRKNDEPYAEFLADVQHCGVRDTERLKAILTKHLDAVLEYDKTTAHEYLDEKVFLQPGDEQRLAGGYYFAHVGLARKAFEYEFGDEWLKYREIARRKKTTP